MDKERAKTIIILAVTALFIAGLAVKMNADETKAKNEITGPSKAFAAALEANDPSAAPDDGADYVRGVRKHFGRIVEARFLEAYTERHGSHRDAQTDIVSEIYVRGKRGAAVLLLDFDGDRLWGVDEVEPGDVHSDLTAAEEKALERGFARRGNEAAGPVWS